MDNDNLEAKFANKVYEVLARHESRFDQLNTTLQTVLTKLQELRMPRSAQGRHSDIKPLDHHEPLPLSSNDRPNTYSHYHSPLKLSFPEFHGEDSTAFGLPSSTPTIDAPRSTLAFRTTFGVPSLTHVVEIPSPFNNPPSAISFGASGAPEPVALLLEMYHSQVTIALWKPGTLTGIVTPNSLLSFSGVREQTGEGNDLHKEMIENGVIQLGDKPSEGEDVLSFIENIPHLTQAKSEVSTLFSRVIGFAKKPKKRKHKRNGTRKRDGNNTCQGMLNGFNSSSANCVDFQEVGCSPGIELSTDAAASVDGVVAKKNVFVGGKSDVKKTTRWEHRRTVSPDTISFLDSDPDIFITHCGSESFGAARYYRHVRQPFYEVFAKIVMLMGKKLGLHDQFKDCRLHVDNLSYEQLLELATLEIYDKGKPYEQAAKIEIPMLVHLFQYYASWVDEIHGLTILANGPHYEHTLHNPIGDAANLFHEDRALPGVLNIVSSLDPTIGADLTGHIAVDKVAYTGLTNNGKVVLELAAKSNLKPVTSGLGGKSFFIKCEHADAELAHFALLLTHKQCYCAGSHTIAHKYVCDEFIEEVKALALKRSVYDPFMGGIEQSPQISSEQLEKILKYTRSAAESGATLETKGGILGNKGFYIQPNKCFYIQPTMFTNVQGDMLNAKGEIFGPLPSVLKLTDLNELRRFNIGPDNELTYHNLKGYTKEKENDLMVRGDVEWNDLLGVFKGKGTMMGKPYLNSYESINQLEVETVEAKIRESEVDTAASQYVKRIKSWNGSLASANSASRSNSVDWDEKLDGQSISAVTANDKNPLSNGKQLALTRTVEALMEERLNPEIDRYLVIDPRASKSDPSPSYSHLKIPFKESMVFKISGGYNIKTRPDCSTELMKFDMGGSSTNSGAAKVLRQIKPLRVEVHYVVVAGCIAKQIYEWYTLEEFQGMPTISLGVWNFQV